jgi:aspartate carbamoyltransferase catalytic subunit
MPLLGLFAVRNPSTAAVTLVFSASFPFTAKAGLPERGNWAYTTALMTKSQPPTRHIVSINDLTNKEIETIFEVAQGFLKDLADDNLSYRIARSTDLASKFILASLFYEPSTRTRLSFESAMLRLGGSNITSADPAVSSAAKGESLADTIRVISNYADIVVIRHPRDGAARLAAEYALVPVINGGDGAHEHPTQTLCDLFTLRAKNKSLRNMKVAISGDLKGSRTIHSFVYALARFGATIDPLPAPGMELPAHVDRRLREEFHSRMVSKDTGTSESGRIDALYVTADQPHQLSLYAEPEIDYGLVLQKKTDAVYVTRFQKERWTDKATGKELPYPKIDAKFLGEARYSDASVMHPLPRVNELDASFDSDRRAVYFQQAAYGVPVRMALIALMLHLHKNNSLHKFAGGFAKPDHPVYVQPIGTGVHCHNTNCITCDPAESQYAANKFYVIEAQAGHRLRCVYCEADIDEDVTAHFVTGDTVRKTFSPGLAAIARAAPDKLRHFVIYPSDTDAIAAGFAPREIGKVRTG